MLVLVASGGCHKKDVPNDPGLVNGPGGDGPEETIGGTGLQEFDPETLWDPNTGLQIVYFDYDSFALRPDALSTLRDNAEKIRKIPGVMIQIEGHCDERGTQEYNLTLGEKRALAVREHLMQLGISGDRMVTISYGEEDPAVPGHDESAWQQNRRSEFNKAM
jgi:peptidoglycan-associated lipoprotein